MAEPLPAYKPVTGAENIPEAGATNITLPEVEVEAQKPLAVPVQQPISPPVPTQGVPPSLTPTLAPVDATRARDDLKATDALAGARGQKPEENLPNTRQVFADHLKAGGTATDLTHSFLKPLDVPTAPELHNVAGAITDNLDLPPVPEITDTIKDNLLDTWAQTGLKPNDVYTAAQQNPEILEALTQPQQPPPPAPEPQPQEGFFDPLMHGAEAVAKFVSEGPQNVRESAHELVQGVEALTAEPKKLIATLTQQFAPKPGEDSLAKRIAASDISNAINVALATGGALSVAGSLKGMFRTPAQTAGAVVKAETKGAIRLQRGMGERYKAQASAKLEQYRADLQKAVPEFERWVTQAPAARIGQPFPMVANLIAHMEGRSMGLQLDPASPFKPVADAIRDEMVRLRTELETNHPDVLSAFHDDYYRHLWERPPETTNIRQGRQGSSASTRQRTIPTTIEGIHQGLIPVLKNPIDNAIHYIQGMRDLITQQEILAFGKDRDYVKYTTNNRPPPGNEDWVQLSGRGSEKQHAYIDKAGEAQVINHQAYAHPGFAKIYNNFFSKGFYSTKFGGTIFDALQRTANLATAFKLAISGYHAIAISGETVMAGIANAQGQLAHGDLAGAVKQVLSGVSIAPQVAKGARLQNVYKGAANLGPDVERIVNQYARAGGRAMGNGQELIGQDGPIVRSFNFFSKASRAQAAQQFRTDLRGLGSPTGQAAVPDALIKTGRAGALVGKWMGQLLASNPANRALFGEVIPKVKFAAFSDELSTWLEHNPQASQEALDDMSRKLVDSMDNRFGEMVQDNLFWNRYIKQTANLLSVSVGWEWGTFRAFGGAAKDIMSGHLLGIRARWLYSFMAYTALMNSMYQYLKTGQSPTQSNTPIHDMIAPRTGGTVTYGRGGVMPERALLPGYQKDPAQWYFAAQRVADYTEAPLPTIGGLAANKLSPLWRVIRGVASGNDPFSGNPIHYHPDDPTGFKDYLDYVIHELGTPIGVATAAQRQPGSKVDLTDLALGIRPAGINLTAPKDVAESYERYQNTKSQMRALKSEARKKAEQATPAPAAPPGELRDAAGRPLPPVDFSTLGKKKR